MKKFLLLIYASFFMSSCEKILEIDVPNPEQQLVVDGSIELDGYAVVYLTNSMPFFSSIDSTDFIESIVSVARVSVSNGTEKEYLTLFKDLTYYPPFYYKSTEIKGEIDKEYFLQIDFRGETTTATTTIPSPPGLDSAWFEGEEKHQDTMGLIKIKFTDASDTKNYYRTFIRVDSFGKRFVPTQINTFDDIYFNGNTMEFALFNGEAENKELSSENKFFASDKPYEVKVSCMDKQTFEFWNTYQGNTLNLAGISSGTKNPASNIHNGLGIWSGYASSIMKVSKTNQ